MVSIQAVVIKILEGIAVLKNGSEEFHWPLHYLPAGIKTGDEIVFQTARPKAERDGRSEGALNSRATERGASLQNKEVSEEDQYERMRKLLEEMIN